MPESSSPPRGPPPERAPRARSSARSPSSRRRAPGAGPPSFGSSARGSPGSRATRRGTRRRWASPSVSSPRWARPHARRRSPGKSSSELPSPPLAGAHRGLPRGRRVGYTPDMAMAPMIHGHCDPRFLAVRDAFAANFAAGREVGASFATTVEGEPVVDLWGGYADAATTRPWERDTLVNVYSTSKGMTALCAHLLVDRGELDLDAPVARYWPEFAQAGKEELPVRWLLSHRAGVIAPREPVAERYAHDWDHVCAALAAAAPWWEPGTAQGYHAVTFGYLVGEVVRRISGVSLGAFLRREIAGPLGARVFIGTPAEEHARCAEMVGQLDEARIAERFPGIPQPPFRSLADHPLAVVMLALTYIPTGDVNTAAYR